MTKPTVQDAMTPWPAFLASDAHAIDAARAMMSEGVGSLPVVEGGQLVGIVTDRDLVMQVMSKDLDPNNVLLSDVCSESPVVATPEEPLEAALRRMAQEQVRRLPVVSDGHLVGILAQADVAKVADAAETGHMVEAISTG